MPKKSYQDILMPPVNDNEKTSYLTPEWGGIGKKMSRVEAKREGLPVDMNPHDHTVQGDASRTQQNGGASTQPQQTEKILDLQGMIDLLNKDKARKDEDIAKREAALKRAKTFATIGDALSAFHTAYSNARGVQSMVPAGTSLSGKWRERYDNLMKEKDANEQAHLQQLMRIDDLKRKKEAEERNQRLTEARINKLVKDGDFVDLKSEKARLEIQLAAETNPLKVEQLQANIDKIDASIKRIEAQTGQAQAAAANSMASAAKNNAQAEKYRSDGEGKTTTTSQTKTDSHGRTTTTETTQTVTPAGQSGKKPASNNTPPSRQNAKKNVVTAADDKTPPSRRKRK